MIELRRLNIYAIKVRSETSFDLENDIYVMYKNRGGEKDIQRGGLTHKGFLADPLHQVEGGRRSCVHICSIVSQWAQ